VNKNQAIYKPQCASVDLAKSLYIPWKTSIKTMKKSFGKLPFTVLDFQAEMHIFLSDVLQLHVMPPYLLPKYRIV